MARASFKYNPGFLSDGDLIESFTVRKAELSLLLDVIRENKGESTNRHVLVVGPRGLGKTTLVRTIAATVRTSQDFRRDWYPVVYGEESYGIGTPGEFWLECIYHIQRQELSSPLKSLYDDLHSEESEDNLEKRALEAIIEFARNMGRRIIIFVENLNDIFDEQLTSSDGWSLRHTLQTCPEIMLFATATTFFDEIENSDNALFEQFKVHTLEPLTLRDCRRLWNNISGENLTEREIRPVQILTGGNPRLLQIWAEFASELSFGDLVEKVSHLVDEYTDYFKSQLEKLPAAERKIFIAVLELWDPSTTKMIATASRSTVNQASSLLNRLERRGAIARDSGSPSRWSASERLFNIYYLMRRRGTPSSRVQALVKFMTVYYGRDQLVERAKDMAKEACSLESDRRQDHYFAFADLFKRFDVRTRGEILKSVPNEFFSGDNVPAELKRYVSESQKLAETSAERVAIGRALAKAMQFVEKDKFSDAMRTLEAARLKYNEAVIPSLQSIVSMMMNNWQAAIDHGRASLEMEPGNARVMQVISRALRELDRDDEALEVLEQALELSPDDSSIAVDLGSFLSETSDNLERAAELLTRAVSLDPSSAKPRAILGGVLAELGREGEALRWLKEAVSLEPDDLAAWGTLGDFYLLDVHDLPNAEAAFRKVTELEPDSARGWFKLAQVTGHDPAREAETTRYYSKAIEAGPADAEVYQRYAHHQLVTGRIEEAEATLKQGLEFSTNPAELWASLGGIYAQHDNVAATEEAFQKAVELEPDTAVFWTALGSYLRKLPGREAEAEAALRRSIALDPADCSPLNSLGKLLLATGRTADAEASFAAATGVEGGCSCALGELWGCFKSEKSRLNEAEEIFRSVVKANPGQGYPEFLLGEVLLDLGRTKEALSAYEASANHGGPMHEMWPSIIRALFVISDNNDDVQQGIEKFIKGSGRSVSSLNGVAWSIVGLRENSLFDAAARYALEAYGKAPDEWAVCHTLAAALLAAGRDAEALRHIVRLANTASEREFGDFIDLCIYAAQYGQASDLLRVLENAPQAARFEPVIMALKLVMNEDIHVAEEVRQVAADIAAQMKSESAPTSFLSDRTLANVDC